mmetsp:Transcript_37040/g.115278  ORF Transcript_37040/g.115278 Transcript_37040/m.115278 type:complete len:262 (+) Transcript_37040:380-1165(+)
MRLFSVCVCRTITAPSTLSSPNISWNFFKRALSLRNSGGMYSTSTVVLWGGGIMRSHENRRSTNDRWARTRRISVTATTYHTRTTWHQGIQSSPANVPRSSLLSLSTRGPPRTACSGARTRRRGAPMTAKIRMESSQNSRSIAASRPAVRSTSSELRDMESWNQPKKVSERQELSTIPARTLWLYMSGYTRRRKWKATSEMAMSAKFMLKLMEKAYRSPTALPFTPTTSEAVDPQDKEPAPVSPRWCGCALSWCECVSPWC